VSEPAPQCGAPMNELDLLIRGVAQGDPESCTQLDARINRCAEPEVNRVLKDTRARAEVDIVLQEVKMIVIKWIQSKQSITNLEAWATRIARNAAISELRRAKRKKEILLSAEAYPELAATRTELESETLEKIAFAERLATSLRGDDRVIWEGYMRGRPNQEVAGELNLSKSTFERKKAKLFKRLKESGKAFLEGDIG
jgi:RNA polymerase sigma factor (sigma-70 family)